MFLQANLDDFEKELEYEGRSLQQERGKQERMAVSITDQMYIEAQVWINLLFIFCKYDLFEN